MNFALFFFLSCAVPPVLAYPLNQTEPIYAFFPNPPGRGTIGLVYTCILTLALCLWTAMHQDVAFHKEHWFYGAAYKGFWMFLAIILPEFLVSCAVAQFLEARDLRKAWESHWDEIDGDNSDKARWLGLSGAFLVVMGGYEITCPATCSGNPAKCPMADSESGSTTPPDEAISLRAAEHLTPAGAATIEAKTLIEKPPQRSSATRLTLTPAGLKELLKTKGGHSVISELVGKGVLNYTHFDRCQIKDKGKANYVAKFLTTVQILWIVVQWIGRKDQGLTVTLLEVHVLIQIPYTLVAYFFWWKKPLDVGVPISLPISHRLQEAKWDLSGSDFNVNDSYPLRHEQLVRNRGIARTLSGVVCRAGYDFAWDFGYKAELWSTAMAALNGGLHATAWVSHFPTPAERGLWRAACVGVGLSPLLICLLVWKRELECFVLQYLHRFATEGIRSISQLTEESVRTWDIVVQPDGGGDNFSGPRTMQPPRGLPATWPLWRRRLLAAGVIVLGVLYATSITFFLVEAFISLRSVEASAYKTVEWADYLPHF